MRSTFSIGLAAVAAALFLFCSVKRVSAQQEIILHSFNGTDDTDGNEPVGPLVFDGSGNLYGTTFNGGIFSYGNVFKLTPGTSGWTETTLFSFDGEGGNWPTSGLVFDSAGNLYGTTFFGGALSVGTAFEISPTSEGEWRETGMHDFSPFAHDGTYPRSGLIFDRAGNAYGTTPGGGTQTWGTVFELSPIAGGGWKEKILHDFDVTDGSQPSQGLVMDSAGNLYGATGFGGSSSACFGGCGVVFEVSPNAGGGWGEKVLLNFSGNNGANPFTSLTIDSAGNLYGMTSAGGLYNWGIVFKLSHVAGAWKETILHNFNSNGIDGNNGAGNLVQDASGNLFGATASGGTYNDGTVFELLPGANGRWKETILYSFNPNGSDGYIPGSGPILDGSGNLYGTTENGGAYGAGAVYEVKR